MRDDVRETPDYLATQLITSLGNKRALAEPLDAAVREVRARLGGRRLRTLDLFAGSGFVSRLLKQHSSVVLANDLERYAEVAGRCFLVDREPEVEREAAAVVARLNREADSGADVDGFIRRMYAPVDDQDIQPGERVFYTGDNARRLDFFARALQATDEPVRTLVLGPLLAGASVHANTSGVFKGFYKDKATGVGKFGAAGAHALSRILRPIRLAVPVSSAFTAESRVTRQDANALVSTGLPELDLTYLDPPYNQHPYGSNYFMLNLLVDYAAPAQVSRVSGIPVGWNRSGFNVRGRSLPLLSALVRDLPSRFVLLSFNAEGYVAPADLRELLGRHGRVDEVVLPYPTFRGSRNLRQRSARVSEHLFLLDRDGSSRRPSRPGGHGFTSLW